MPDSAHGTNPASTAIAGYQTVQIKSDANGEVDLLDLERNLDEDVAALMITVPNTLGLFESRILEATGLCHAKGAQVYMDGANLNALLGLTRPGDLGFDVVHMNLHKTFTTPHGGGGPGAGPVAFKAHLAPFMPTPVVSRDADAWRLDWKRPKSIGKVQSFWGNFGMHVRALHVHPHDGPRRAPGRLGERDPQRQLHPGAPPAALRPPLRGRLDARGRLLRPAGRRRKASPPPTSRSGSSICGFYAPSIYFPLIVDEAMMIEPTETESKETLDQFCDAMIQIAGEVGSSPTTLLEAPVTTPVRRLDQTTAARQPNLRWTPKEPAR